MAANVDPATRPVYHLAIAAAKDPKTGQLLDKMLTDGQWAVLEPLLPKPKRSDRKPDK